MKNVRIEETLKKRKIGVYFQVCFCFKSLRISVWRNFIIQLGMFTGLFGGVRKRFDKIWLIYTTQPHLKLLFLHLWPNRKASIRLSRGVELLLEFVKWSTKSADFWWIPSPFVSSLCKKLSVGSKRCSQRANWKSTIRLDFHDQHSIKQRHPWPTSTLFSIITQVLSA